MHLWSLGVEEQFYLVWPLLLFWCGSSRKSLAAAGAIALVSFVLAASWSVGNPVHAFFNPLSRGWELLAGVDAAHAVLRVGIAVQ